MKIVIIYDEKIAGKYAKKMVFAYISAVASFMDAWIEISPRAASMELAPGRILHGCVDFYLMNLKRFPASVVD